MHRVKYLKNGNFSIASTETPAQVAIANVARELNKKNWRRWLASLRMTLGPFYRVTQKKVFLGVGGGHFVFLSADVVIYIVRVGYTMSLSHSWIPEMWDSRRGSTSLALGRDWDQVARGTLSHFVSSQRNNACGVNSFSGQTLKWHPHICMP